MLWWQPGRRHAHERLRHEAGDEVVLARDLGADLAVRGEPVRGAQRVVEGEVELELSRRVLVVALDHVETHRPGVLDHPQVDEAQALELVDVVAVGVGEPAVRLAVGAALEPHHLRLGAVAQVQPVVLGLELLVDAAQVAAAVGREERSRLLAFLAVAEQRAPQPRHALVPGELAEGLRLRDADQLLVVRAVAEILAVPIEEEVDGRAVDELEPPLRDALPVIGGNALAADPAGNRYELQVQVLDSELIDLLPDLLHHLVPSGCFHEAFDVHRHSLRLLGLFARRHPPRPPGRADNRPDDSKWVSRSGSARGLLAPRSRPPSSCMSAGIMTSSTPKLNQYPSIGIHDVQ